MKKIVLFLTLTSLIFSQEADGEIDDTTPPITVSEEALPSLSKKSSIEERNWIFAAGSTVAAALAIVVVWLNPGKAPSDN